MEKNKIQNQLISGLLRFELPSNQTLIENISKQLSERLIKNLETKIILAPYLHKYRSKKLLDLISRLAKKDISENEYEVVSSIILILESRYRKYKIIAKNLSLIHI